MINKINSDYLGGNILVDEQIGNRIYLRQDQGTTKEHWFYYNFMVKDATAGTYEFIFTDGDVVGPAGPAISHDGVHWSYMQDRIDNAGFKYSFFKGESVYFAFCPYFGLELMEEFLQQNSSIGRTTLCMSNRGNDVPLLRIGNPNKPTIIFTSRHHSCESPGTYALFGALTRLSRDDHFKENFSLLAIPFMDIDGVIYGEQGKGRAPHDHNRDYKQLIYNEVSALQDIYNKNDVLIFIDFHAPWYYGGRNDKVFIVYRSKLYLNNQMVFGEILSGMHRKKDNPLIYDNDDNIMFGEEWNVLPSDTSLQNAVDWFNHKGVNLALTLEVTYTGLEYGAAIPENLYILGDSVGEAIIKYLSTV